MTTTRLNNIEIFIIYGNSQAIGSIYNVNYQLLTHSLSQYVEFNVEQG